MRAYDGNEIFDRSEMNRQMYAVAVANQRTHWRKTKSFVDCHGPELWMRARASVTDRKTNEMETEKRTKVVKTKSRKRNSLHLSLMI